MFDINKALEAALASNDSLESRKTLAWYILSFARNTAYVPGYRAKGKTAEMFAEFFKTFADDQLITTTVSKLDPTVVTYRWCTDDPRFSAIHKSLNKYFSSLDNVRELLSMALINDKKGLTNNIVIASPEDGQGTSDPTTIAYYDLAQERIQKAYDVLNNLEGMCDPRDFLLKNVLSTMCSAKEETPAALGNNVKLAIPHPWVVENICRVLDLMPEGYHYRHDVFEPPMANMLSTSFYFTTGSTAIRELTGDEPLSTLSAGYMNLAVPHAEMIAGSPSKSLLCGYFHNNYRTAKIMSPLASRNTAYLLAFTMLRRTLSTNKVNRQIDGTELCYIEQLYRAFFGDARVTLLPKLSSASPCAARYSNPDGGSTACLNAQVSSWSTMISQSTATVGPNESTGIRDGVMVRFGIAFPVMIKRSSIDSIKTDNKLDTPQHHKFTPVPKIIDNQDSLLEISKDTSAVDSTSISDTEIPALWFRYSHIPLDMDSELVMARKRVKDIIEGGIDYCIDTAAPRLDKFERKDSLVKTSVSAFRKCTKAAVKQDFKVARELTSSPLLFRSPKENESHIISTMHELAKVRRQVYSGTHDHMTTDPHMDAMKLVSKILLSQGHTCTEGEKSLYHALYSGVVDDTLVDKISEMSEDELTKLQFQSPTCSADKRRLMLAFDANVKFNEELPVNIKQDCIAALTTGFIHEVRLGDQIIPEIVEGKWNGCYKGSNGQHAALAGDLNAILSVFISNKDWNRSGNKYGPTAFGTFVYTNITYWLGLRSSRRNYAFPKIVGDLFAQHYPDIKREAESQDETCNTGSSLISGCQLIIKPTPDGKRTRIVYVASTENTQRFITSALYSLTGGVLPAEIESVNYNARDIVNVCVQNISDRSIVVRNLMCAATAAMTDAMLLPKYSNDKDVQKAKYVVTSGDISSSITYSSSENEIRRIGRANLILFPYGPLLELYGGYSANRRWRVVDSDKCIPVHPLSAAGWRASSPSGGLTEYNHERDKVKLTQFD